MAKFPTIEEFAKSVADKVLDDYEYEGKTIREWVELILKDELTEVVRCKDCRFCKKQPTPYGAKMCTNQKWNTEYYPLVEEDDYCSHGERPGR